MKKEVLGLILLSIIIGSIAQILLKTGMNNYGKITPGIDMILAVFHPLVFTGLLMYFISATFWIIVLSKVEVSFAYPFGAINYVIVGFLSWLLLNESLNSLRLLGIGIIISGVYIISKSK